jgi:pimeloyl-ACP methyl ester carboxylesterase
VHGCGGLQGVGTGDATDVLHEAVLEGDWRCQEQCVKSGAVEAFPDERAGADDQKWIRIGRVVGKLVGDLAAFSSGSQGTSVPLNTRQHVPIGTASAFDEFLKDCSAASKRCAFSMGVEEAYSGNREEAYNAIQCADSTVPTDPEDYRRASMAAAKSSPDFGRISVFDTIPCAFWQGHDADRYTGPWNRHTSAPILVLNTRNDPATPLDGAYAGAAQLYGARLVVTQGAGHTSMYVASTCTERVKRDYLFTGVLPPVGTSCSRNRSPSD